MPIGRPFAHLEYLTCALRQNRTLQEDLFQLALQVCLLHVKCHWLSGLLLVLRQASPRRSCHQRIPFFYLRLWSLVALVEELAKKHLSYVLLRQVDLPMTRATLLPLLEDFTELLVRSLLQY